MGPRAIHLNSSCCSEIAMVASQHDYRSWVSFFQFICIFGSMLISSHENGCNITLNSGNIESAVKNSMCSLSPQYTRTVTAATWLSRQSWVCVCKLVGMCANWIIVDHYP